MSKREDLRRCPKCGSDKFMYWEIADNNAGDELHDILECEECGCRYYLVFGYVEKKICERR